MARKAKLTKREIALALGLGALATFAVMGILSDGFGGPGSSFKKYEELEHSETAPTVADR